MATTRRRSDLPFFCCGILFASLPTTTCFSVTQLLPRPTTPRALSPRPQTHPRHFWRPCFSSASPWKPTLKATSSSRIPADSALQRKRTSTTRWSFEKNSPFSLRSTPFDADFYDDDDDDDDEDYLNDAMSMGDVVFSDSTKPQSLSVSPKTRLVVGLNKYSHDTSLCAADAQTGRVLFALSKERQSRKKHDGGNVVSLVEACCNALHVDLDQIDKVVVNNHHFRVLGKSGTEANLAHMEWEDGLRINGGEEDGYTDEENLLSDVPEKYELSHHLAHAYSVASQAPFAEGLIVVMDGMGETYRTMKSALLENDTCYKSDLQHEGNYHCIPSDIAERAAYSIFDWREGESAYVFTKNFETRQLDITPIFKRFVQEKTPPALYNHGFENMDSLGAIYSRASSHIFGDWNACGKVMGMAPWKDFQWQKEESKSVVAPERIEDPIMKGKLYEEGTPDAFEIDRTAMMGLPIVARDDPDLFDRQGNRARRRYDFDDCDPENVLPAPPTPVSQLQAEEIRIRQVLGEEALMEAKAKAEAVTALQEKERDEEANVSRVPTRAALEAIRLSARVQDDLEHVAMDLVRHLKQVSGQTNLCLAGGVALNSVMNGRMSRELGFENFFVPPYPGDDGISVGCCAFGLFGGSSSSSSSSSSGPTKAFPPLWSKPLSPYLGPLPLEAEIRSALNAASPWLQVESVTNEKRRLEIMSREIAAGGVVAWYHGRSEMGPRALGHRSILADPRKKALVRFINEKVKLRESFRPFAPSVLAQEAHEWFELGDLDETGNVSPYMSLTAQVRPEKRHLVPAVTHVDGSSRLQTVTEDLEPSYYKLISAFFEITGVPMVLNTSFNTLRGEPIVENPREAIRSFLSSMNAIEMLVIGDFIVRRKQADVRVLLGEERKDGTVIRAARPKRAGPVKFQSFFEIEKVVDQSIGTTAKVQMPARPIHDERDGSWFTLLDDLEFEILAACDGTVTVNEFVAGYADVTDKDENDFLENLFDNVLQRLVRLYEFTLVGW